MEIINLFYELAQQCTYFNGFVYNNTHQKGAGMEAHPLMWLDDPINGKMVLNGSSNIIYHTINVDLLDIPTTDADVPNIQAKCLEAGLAVIEKIKLTRFTTGYNIDNFNWLTLRNYYDNNAAGIRFSIVLTQANPIDRCADYFDPSKQFPTTDLLPDFSVDNHDGCAVFNDGLPKFSLKNE